MSRTGSLTEDIKKKIEKPRVNFKMLNKIWKTKSIGINTKIRLYISNIRSVLVYGSLTWSTGGDDVRKLESFSEQVFDKNNGNFLAEN